MGNNRQHHHNQFIRLFKNAFTAFAFGVPLFFVYLILLEWFKNSVFPIDKFLLLLPTIIFAPICILIAAYFYTDLEVVEKGLLVEFLWKKLEVPWTEVLQIKPLFGIKVKKQGIYVVIVNGLTPFHRLFGLIYGFSLKPAFILWSNVDKFEILKNDIERHVKKNRKENP